MNCCTVRSFFKCQMDILPAPRVIWVGENQLGFLNSYRDFVRHRHIRVFKIGKTLNCFNPYPESRRWYKLVLKQHFAFSGQKVHCCYSCSKNCMFLESLPNRVISSAYPKFTQTSGRWSIPDKSDDANAISKRMSMIMLNKNQLQW